MPETAAPGHNARILVLNPNSSEAMTNGMVAAARRTPVSELVRLHAQTAPSHAPDSINNDEDIQSSNAIILEEFKSNSAIDVEGYGGILVACFSVHPLVTDLQARYPTIAVTGIFEASILTALSLIHAASGREKWAIVTTGSFWEKHLSDGVADFLGHDRTGQNHKFAGVYSTGLNAGDFHTISPEDVKQKLSQATKRLLQSGNITCVVMGCGGMAGLEDVIRSTASEVYGKARADHLYIVDGVQAGVMQLHQAINSRGIFR